MREIKFRVFYKPENCMKQVHSIDVHNRFVYWFDEGNREKQSCHYSLDGKYGDAILMQYTGLKDKNGKEVFEKDIVHLSSEDGMNYNALIIFADGAFCAIDGTEDDYGVRRYGLMRYELQMEVIGNIYENPDLLEDTK